jgi:YNFM family putative membrane transporter
VTERAASRRTLAVVLAGFCAFVDLYATQPLLPLLARIFNASEVFVSLTVTAATFGVALAAPFAGTISDHYGRKRTIIWSAAALGICTVMSAAAGGLRLLIFFRFLQGVFTPGIFAVTVAYIHDEWRGSESGRAMAAYVTGTVIGGFSGRFVSGLVVSHLNWQWVFVVLGLSNLAGALAMWRWLPRETAPHHAPETGGWAAVLEHLRNPKLTATYAVGFCVLFSLASTFTYITFYLAAPPFHLRPASLGSLFFVYLIGAVITPASGRWIDHFGQRIALAASISSGVAGILLTLSKNLVVVIIGLAICCTGVFIAQAAASSYIGVATNRNRALAVGLYVTCYYIGGSAGAAIPGFFWRAGGWPACVVLIGAVQALTVAMALLLWSPGFVGRTSVRAGL